MVSGVQPYAKIVTASTVVIALQQIDPTSDVLDPDFTWVPITGVTCSDGSPVVVGSTYNGSVFTSMPDDVFGRSVSLQSDGVTDVYTVLDPYGNDGVFDFPFGTAQSTVYQTIDAAVPILASAIQANLRAFNAALLIYTGMFFSTDTRFQFFVLYYLAVQGGLTNRAAYIQPLLSWAEAMISYASTYAANVQAQSTPAAVYATTWNFQANTPAVPDVTLIGAINISN